MQDNEQLQVSLTTSSNTGVTEGSFNQCNFSFKSSFPYIQKQCSTCSTCSTRPAIESVYDKAIESVHGRAMERVYGIATGKIYGIAIGSVYCTAIGSLYGMEICVLLFVSI